MHDLLQDIPPPIFAGPFRGRPVSWSGFPRRWTSATAFSKNPRGSSPDRRKMQRQQQQQKRGGSRRRHAQRPHRGLPSQRRAVGITRLSAATRAKAATTHHFLSSCICSARSRHSLLPLRITNYRTKSLGWMKRRNKIHRLLCLQRYIEAFHESCRVLVRMEGNLLRVGTVNVAVTILVVQHAWLHDGGHPQLFQAFHNEVVLTSTPNSTAVLDVVLQGGGCLPGNDFDWTLQTVEPLTVFDEDTVPAISVAWHVGLQMGAEPAWNQTVSGSTLTTQSCLASFLLVRSAFQAFLKGIAFNGFVWAPLRTCVEPIAQEGVSKLKLIPLGIFGKPCGPHRFSASVSSVITAHSLQEKIPML